MVTCGYSINAPCALAYKDRRLCKNLHVSHLLDIVYYMIAGNTSWNVAQKIVSKNCWNWLFCRKNAPGNRGRAAATFHYSILLEICQALFIRQIKQKILGGQSEVFRSFCSTGWQLVASLPRTANEGDSDTPPLG
jgi:hypothetical protein